jgi:protease IV
MKTSKILTEILRHVWLMDLRAVNGFLPVVANWLKGNEVVFENKDQMVIRAATAASMTPDDVEGLDDMPDNSVVIVPIKGEMLKYDTLCSYGTMSLGGLMKQAAMSKNIAGVVLDVDSPGGSVNAVPPILDAIDAVKRANKPVVVHGDLVASAALFAAVHGDYVLADNELSSEFGSIGVMTQFADYSDYWEKEGIKIHTVYAPESKDKNAEVERALKGDYEPLQKNILSPIAVQFQNAVKAARGKKLELNEPGLLSGKMFIGSDSVRTGLADGIGNLYRSVEMAFALAEVKRFKR